MRVQTFAVALLVASAIPLMGQSSVSGAPETFVVNAQAKGGGGDTAAAAHFEIRVQSYTSDREQKVVTDALKSGGFKGVVVLGGSANQAVALVASVTPDFTAKAQAGKIIQGIAPIVGGKGGGKPDNARGGGKDPAKLDEALQKARTLLAGA